MICCVAFDFDGTLVDSNAIKYTSFLDVAAELPGGTRIMSAVIERQSNVTRYEVFDRFVAEMGIPEMQQAEVSRKMAEQYSVLCHAEICKAAAISGADDTLQHLSESGMHLFVSSATPVESLRALVAARGWWPMFRGVYGAPASKEAHIRQILKEGGWAPEQLVYVGDSDADLVAAKETGCTFVGVCLGGEQGRFSTRPAHRIENLEKLPELLAGGDFMASVVRDKNEFEIE